MEKQYCGCGFVGVFKEVDRRDVDLNGVKTYCVIHKCPSCGLLIAEPAKEYVPPTEAVFDPPLDQGIAEAVKILVAADIETFESCEGGEGHSYPEPTIRFHGGQGAGWRAISAVLANGVNVKTIRRVWDIIDKEPTGAFWEITLWATTPAPKNEVETAVDDLSKQGWITEAALELCTLEYDRLQRALKEIVALLPDEDNPEGNNNTLADAVHIADAALKVRGFQS